MKVSSVIGWVLAALAVYVGYKWLTGSLASAPAVDNSGTATPGVVSYVPQGHTGRFPRQAINIDSYTPAQQRRVIHRYANAASGTRQPRYGFRTTIERYPMGKTYGVMA